MTRTTEIENKGRAEELRGGSRQHCPYDKRTKEGRAWMKGFNDSEKERREAMIRERRQ